MLKYLIIILSCCFQVVGASKYAILIGIGAYPKEVGAIALSGDNDLDLMKTTVTGLGFEEKKIFSLKNQAATKENILNTFNKVYKTLQKDDILLIHYSGHGRQVVDDDIDTQKGIKEEVDGYDEAILCYDGKYLIDDEIHDIFQQIQIKIGSHGQMVVFFDCCYSGTMTRDLQMLSNQKNFEELKISSLNNLYFFSSVTSSGKSQDNTAGLLTEALSKSFRYPLKTYGDLFAKIQEEITKKPNTPNNFYLLPTFEGNGNSMILGQDAVENIFFYEIQKVYPDSLAIVINAGKLSGIFENTEISIFPIGTHSVTDSKPLYKGVVTVADNFSSKISFTQKLYLSNPKAYWIFITKPSFDSYKINIAVDKKDSINLAKLFKEYSFLRLTTKIENSLYSLKVADNENVLLDNFGFKEVKVDKDIRNVLTVAQQFARVSILKKIESVNNPDYRITIELIPISKHNIDLRDSISKTLYLYENTPMFDTTMRALLKVTNTGSKDCYFSVINISSNSEIQSVLPSNDNRKFDYFLPKGKSFVSDEILGFTLPFGNEILIGFANKKPLNLYPIINNTWTQQRSNDSPFNTLLNGIYNGERSLQEDELKKLEGSIYKYHYRIIPENK